MSLFEAVYKLRITTQKITARISRSCRAQLRWLYKGHHQNTLLTFKCGDVIWIGLLCSFAASAAQTPGNISTIIRVQTHINSTVLIYCLL